MNLHVKKLHELLVARSDRAPYLCAASGLVLAGAQLYVIADDELHLGVFDSAGDHPGALLRLFSGELPPRPKQRKKHKPDLEVLLRLPSFGAYPHGALLALGSGSRPQRCRGVLLALTTDGKVHGMPQVLDTSRWFAELAMRVNELNLEGGWCSADDFYLLQRGNKGNGANAVLQFSLGDLLSALQSDTLSPPLRAVHYFDLGDVEGVPLCFSDACALGSGEWLFTAVAENTDDAYTDGACRGAAIGLVDAQQRLRWLRRITPEYKIEGIEVQRLDGTLRLLLVTDADDPAVPAWLLTAELPEIP